MSAPQTPTATAKGFPRSIRWSLGLASPRLARFPEASIGWQLSGSPIGCISRAASNSRMPGFTPRSTRLTASDAWQAANSNWASWSISLVARSPSLGSISIRVALTTRPPGPVIALSVSTMKDGVSSQVSGVVVSTSPKYFQPATPTAPALRHAMGGEDVGERRRLPTVLPEEAERRIEHHLEVERRDRRIALVFRSGDEDRAFPLFDDQERFLEARLEPGKIGDVGEVFPVGIDDEDIEIGGLHPLGDALEPALIDRCRKHRHDVGHAELRKRDVDQSDRSQEKSPHLKGAES